jgi:hypothetical protein
MQPMICLVVVLCFLLLFVYKFGISLPVTSNTKTKGYIKEPILGLVLFLYLYKMYIFIGS